MRLLRSFLLRWIAAGALFVAGLTVGLHGRTVGVHASEAPMQPVVKLHRFNLKPDQLETFNRWVAFEHAHHAETLATLDREHMYVEAIFRDKEHDPTTIYWLEVRGQNGASVDTSTLPIDKVYDDFMHRTLVPGSRRTMLPEYTLIPDALAQRMRDGGQNSARQESSHP